MPLLLQQGHRHYPPYTPSRYLSIGLPLRPRALGLPPTMAKHECSGHRDAGQTFNSVSVSARPSDWSAFGRSIDECVGGLLVGGDGIRYARSQFTPQLVIRPNY